MICRGEAYLLPPRPKREIKVGLAYLIQNQYNTIVLIVLASKKENDMKVVRRHWFISLHMPTPSVIASAVKQCA